jgi:hypothetical protein
MKPMKPMKPNKFFNFILPFDTYRKLRMIAIEREISIAELIRQGIEFLLKNADERNRDGGQ